MTNEQLNIICAASEGWEWIPSANRWMNFAENVSAVSLDGYGTDLNAMHRLENRLNDRVRYKNWLVRICDHGCPFDATAAQRREAFVRTIGKWEEEL